MSDPKQALKERRRLQKLIKKKDKPKFLRYDWDKYYRLERQETWRKPRGRDNPMRLQLSGYSPKVDPGFGTPKEIRGLHPSGLKPVIVRNMKELEDLKGKQDVIVYIASTVGLKKRTEMVSKAKELGIRLANG
ncbi:MAG: 50S ribosomal protein L32e [Sulfolobales archaeon]|nr:50S ribosomal protein L32e [Sulfolobales archaeon]MCG2883821.1 50S ribosomal protein L32e [Sulfolobales archaeon]MCG2908435.1 50S ribosomal protein L32e [Sulfolobales archaeon]